MSDDESRVALRLREAYDGTSRRPPRAASTTWPAATGTRSLGNDPIGEERLVLNMGPQHPSTHGVLRLVLELEGETVTDARVVVGYLHTGIEKNVEFRTWTQAVTFLTRADYLSPFFTETAYCMGVERAARRRGARRARS